MALVAALRCLFLLNFFFSLDLIFFLPLACARAGGVALDDDSARQLRAQPQQLQRPVRREQELHSSGYPTISTIRILLCPLYLIY